VVGAGERATSQAHWVVDAPSATRSDSRRPASRSAIRRAREERREQSRVGFAWTSTADNHSPGIGTPARRRDNDGAAEEAREARQAHRVHSGASLAPADIGAPSLVNAAPLTSVTRHRLNFILDTADMFLERGKPDRAARGVRTFALEVAQHRDRDSAGIRRGHDQSANATAEC
jgi:hypothetical protein